MIFSLCLVLLFMCLLYCCYNDAEWSSLNGSWETTGRMLHWQDMGPILCALKMFVLSFCLSVYFRRWRLLSCHMSSWGGQSRLWQCVSVTRLPSEYSMTHLQPVLSAKQKFSWGVWYSDYSFRGFYENYCLLFLMDCSHTEQILRLKCLTYCSSKETWWGSFV